MRNLKSIFILTLTLLFMFSSVAFAMGKEFDKEIHKLINPSIKWDSKKAAQVETEMDKILKGDREVTTMSFNVQNMTYIRTDTLNASDLPYATASGTFKLYRENVPDNNYDYYVVWMKGTGINAVNTGPFGDNSNLYEVRVSTYLNRANDRITDWEPYSDITMNENYVTVSLGVSHGGVNASISEDILLHRDHIGPAAIYTTSYFKAHWNGNYEGSQGVVAGLEMRVPKGTGYKYTIGLLVDGGQY